MNACRARVWIDPGNVGAWYDFSGRGASVVWDGGEVAAAEQHTFDGDYPEVETGKPGMVTVTCKAMYSEGALETTERLRAVYEAGCGRDLGIRWIPAGNVGGSKQYTISGHLITPVWPNNLEAGSADITLIEFKAVGDTVHVDDV